MKYAEIIKDSWHLTVENPRIKWLVLIPSFFGVLIFTIEIAWQLYLYADKYDLMDITAGEGYGILLNYVTDNSLWGVSILAVLLIALFMFIVPLWVQGTLILCVRHKLVSPDTKFFLRTKMLKGLEYFFPFFKFEAATSLFSLLSIAFFAASIHRYFESLFELIWPIIEARFHPLRRNRYDYAVNVFGELSYGAQCGGCIGGSNCDYCGFHLL